MTEVSWEKTARSQKRAQTFTASRTLAIADAGKVVEMNVASQNDLNIALFANVAYPLWTPFRIRQKGAGSTIIRPVAGVTINGLNSYFRLPHRYAHIDIYQEAADQWIAEGAPPTFEIANKVTKITGNTLNPATELGARAGDFVLVIVADQASSLPATPSGWTERHRQSNWQPSGFGTAWSYGIFTKNVTGSEGAVTFLSTATGPITAYLINGGQNTGITVGNEIRASGDPGRSTLTAQRAKAPAIIFGVGFYFDSGGNPTNNVNHLEFAADSTNLDFHDDDVINRDTADGISLITKHRVIHPNMTIPNFFVDSLDQGTGQAVIPFILYDNNWQGLVL